jgi:hypothetical protein
MGDPVMPVRPDRDRDTFLLALFLGTDVVFMTLHVLHTSSGFFTDRQFSLAHERGFAETFQYLKEGWISVILLSFSLKTPNLLYLAWAGLFGYLLVDDLFQIHERLGFELGNHFGLPVMFSLRPQDLGELAVSGSAAAFFSVLIGVGHYRANPSARSISRSVLVLVLTLAFFGVVVDTIHAMVSHPIGQLVLDIAEDGGEMLVMSVILWFVFRSFHGLPSRPQAPLCGT